MQLVITPMDVDEDGSGGSVSEIQVAATIMPVDIIGPELSGKVRPWEDSAGCFS